MSSSALGVALGICLGCSVSALIISLGLVSELFKVKGRDGARLRAEGHALHGRLVFEDRIGWEREIARWGLDSNGRLAFDMPSDYTVYSGYLIAGPSDVPDELRTKERSA